MITLLLNCQMIIIYWLRCQKSNNNLNQLQKMNNFTIHSAVSILNYGFKTLLNSLLHQNVPLSKKRESQQIMQIKFFPKNLRQSSLSHNTYKLNKKDSEYLRTKAYSMDLAYGNDQKIFDCILMKVKQSCIDFNLSLRKKGDEINENIDYVDLTLLNNLTHDYKQKFNQEKFRILTIQKQSFQLKLRRINNNHLSSQKILKKKSPHIHNQIKKLVEKNQFFIGRKIDQMMMQLIQEDDALIPPSQPIKKLNQIQQGIITLMNQENDDTISSKERYQLIKEKNNNRLMNYTSPQEVKLLLEKKLLKYQMRHQGLLWERTNTTRYEKRDIKQIILDRKTKVKKQSKERYLEDVLKEATEKELDKSFASQTTKGRTSGGEDSSYNENDKPILKNLIKKSLSEKEPIGEFIQRNDLEKLENFITRKINSRLNESLLNQQQESIEQIQQYLDQFNQNLHQLPISIIKKLIYEQESRKQFIFSLMTRIEQLDFAKNEIFIELIKKLQLEKQDVRIQLEQINLTLEQKYTNQVHNYLNQLQPMIQNAQNQQNFVQLINKKKEQKNIKLKDGRNRTNSKVD